MGDIVGGLSLRKRLLCGIAWIFAIFALLCGGSAIIGPWNGIADAVAATLPLAPILALAGLGLSLAAGRFRGHIWLWAMALCAGAIACWHILPEWVVEEAPRQQGRAIVIVTHNLHHGGTSPERMAAVLAASGADILLLQENDRRSAKALDSLTSLYPYRDPCRACEQAIFSRWPMDVHWRLPDEEGKATGPALFRADVHIPGMATPLRVVTVHVPRPIPLPGQKPFLQALATGLRHSRPTNIVLAGDFNLVPWSSTMTQLEQDLAPLHRITRGQPTYPAMLAGISAPLLPIDHIFVSPDLAFGRVSTLPPTGSDHLAVRTTVWMHDRQ